MKIKFKDYMNEVENIVDIYRLFTTIKKTTDTINSNASRGNYNEALKDIKILKTKVLTDLEKEINRRSKQHKNNKI